MSTDTLPGVQSDNQIEFFVNQESYPISKRETSEYRALVEHCREQLKLQGACVLPGFLTTQACNDMAEEAKTMAPMAHHNEVTGNAYLTEIDESWPADDPRRMVDTTSLGAIGYDQMPESSLVRRLYELDGLM
ncbi:MAG: hypothetical protein K2X81_06655, partial [Candidatus Obscuribacterales bacterium]|nr:hypothetical protein [Candidatus Obscuribacterales bacterium]